MYFNSSGSNIDEQQRRSGPPVGWRSRRGHSHHHQSRGRLFAAQVHMQEDRYQVSVIFIIELGYRATPRPPPPSDFKSFNGLYFDEVTLYRDRKYMHK